MRILIVDDDKELVPLISRALKEDSHAVDASYDGPNGEELALSENYDLIILDIMLPKKDGLAVLSTLRDEGITTPVLLLTARDEVCDRVVGLDAGADDYLGKPFAVAELRARVRALLRRQSNDKSSLLSVGNLLMDIAGHDVRIGENRIELTSREFAILEYLMRNKGRLVTKGMIAEHVWDFEFNSDYNLIEVYINRLRQKLEQFDGRRLIHTIRKSGYVLREPET
ncbi:MAG: response regulator transcription factor [candidate division KSB1 bacterium]|nr:response regulator transcription factor [candidate division KSB1 bacterium]MDZ7302196.1 response regulator transcription factor [candidate division KSB1 bacterium]MDZ7311305.1 response regulator transcription factor [candidate division KSB1 bacterium]